MCRLLFSVTSNVLADFEFIKKKVVDAQNEVLLTGHTMYTPDRPVNPNIIIIDFVATERKNQRHSKSKRKVMPKDNPSVSVCPEITCTP